MAGNSPALAVRGILANPGSECDRTDKRQHTTHAVDNRRTGEIVEAQLAQPAAAPGPVTFDRVDEQGDESAVNQIHGELGAFCHGTAHDRGGRGAEHGLEDQETLHGEVTLVERQVTPVGGTDEAGAVAAEHEAETDKPEQQGAEHEVHKILHQDVRRVLAAGETRLTQCKARLHEENEHRSQQHPYSIEGNS